MLAHGLRHGIGMTRLAKMSKVNLAFKQFMTTTEWKQLIYLPGQDCWRSMDIADVSLNLDRSCGICRPFQRQGRY